VQQVGKANSQTSVTLSPNPSVFGQPVLLTAVVAALAPGGGTPTGSVTFYDGATALGTATLSNGSASLTTAALGGGAHSVTAVYSVVDANFTGSSSAPGGQIVGPAATATGVASSLNPSGFGQMDVHGHRDVDGGVPPESYFLDEPPLGTASLAAARLLLHGDSPSARTRSPPRTAGATSPQHLERPDATVQNLYTFTGFLPLMATAGTLGSPTFSAPNYGSAVPMKWKLQNGAGTFLSDLATTQVLQAVAYTGGACSGQASGQVYLLYKPTTGATGGSTFRFDAGSNQFIFNWDTSSVPGPGCYELELQLNDGSAIKATIEKLQ
jgi:hypothetical protein